jgi:hypothetical protein
MNLITVTWKNDLHNLLYQAYSLKKNWLGKKEWIIVAEDNDSTYSFVLNRIIPVMDEWNVILVKAPPMSSKIGWWRQQICKFWAASEINQDQYSLILDSKNILINPISDDWFFVDGKTKVRIWQKEWGVNQNNYKECCNFFKGDFDRKLLAWVKTPWVWRKDIVQLTIEEYKKQSCDIYNEEFLPAWEFNAYWFFAQDLIEWEDTEHFGEGIFYYDGVNSGDCNYSLSRVRPGFEAHPFWSFHRLMANHETCSKFHNDFLSRLGIIDESLIDEWKMLCPK